MSTVEEDRPGGMLGKAPQMAQMLGKQLRKLLGVPIASPWALPSAWALCSDPKSEPAMPIQMFCSVVGVTGCVC